jgi:hypothetical protein
VIARIRKLMAVPFARPPGRRSALARFAPEICALAVAALGAAVYLLSGRYPSFGNLPVRCGLLPDSAEWLWKGGLVGSFAQARMLNAAAAACGLAGLLLTLAPVGAMAAALAAERQRGTLEAMLLTPTHHQLLARGRFWHLALPWARAALYALILYLAVSMFDALQNPRPQPPLGGEHVELFSYGAAPWSIRWLDLLGRAFITHSWKAAVSVWHLETIPAGSGHGFVLSGLRWANDASSFVFAAAAAYFISVRAASVRRAVLVSFLAVVAALLTVLSPDAWWLLFSQLAPSRDPSAYLRSYWIIAMLLVAARLVLAFKLVSRVADNFDAYALGEELDKERPATPRLRRRRSV